MGYRLLYGMGNQSLVMHEDDGHVYRYQFDGVDGVLKYVRADKFDGDEVWTSYGMKYFGTIRELREWYTYVRTQPKAP